MKSKTEARLLTAVMGSALMGLMGRALMSSASALSCGPIALLLLLETTSQMEGLPPRLLSLCFQRSAVILLLSDFM